jgi:hypothetical protein
VPGPGSKHQRPIHCNWLRIFRPTHNADARRSFVAAEWRDSNRLLEFVTALFFRISMNYFQLRFPHRSRHKRDRKPTY